MALRTYLLSQHIQILTIYDDKAARKVKAFETKIVDILYDSSVAVDEIIYSGV